MSRSIRVLTLAAVLLSGAAAPALAGIVVYEDGDKKVEIGGRVEAQYVYLDDDNGSTFDDYYFRRLRPYIMGTVSKDFMGKIEFDFGQAEEGDEVRVIDGYFMWTGLENHRFIVGNSKAPFSREFLTSSKTLQVVERSFPGSHNFGSPDRQLGVKYEGRIPSKKLTWAASVGNEDQDPAVERLDFDSSVNRGADWNQGWLYAARVDWHPAGYMSFARTDFGTDKLLYNFSLAAYSWENDDDNNTYSVFDPNVGAIVSTSTEKVDVDEAAGVEVSAGLRGFGFSADAEWQQVSADTIVPGFTGGVYKDGTTDMDMFTVQAGYYLQVVPVEIVVGGDSLDADGYETPWKRKWVGVSWFWRQQKAKLAVTYRSGKDALGVEGADLDEFYVQTNFNF